MTKHAVFFILVGSVAFSRPAFAATQTVDGIEWTYTVSNGEALLGGYSSSSQAISRSTRGWITIPSKLGGYFVTRIGISAFSGCSKLTGITIPDGVTSISSYAFSGCSKLTSIAVPDSVTSIGREAFSGCSGLIQPVYNQSNTTIWFIPSTWTETFAIPDSVTSIGDFAFEGCSGLTSVTIPNSMTNIGSHAFSGCSGLTSITIPNSVTSIGSQAFSGCSGLTSIMIDDENPVFDSRDNCNAIIRTTDNTLIAGCKNTKIPDGVTSIYYAAFQDCFELTSIAIPGSVTSIGMSAFSGCFGLTSITIPDSVTIIGSGVFCGCSGLTSITVDDGNSLFDSRDNCNAIIRTADNTLIVGCKNTKIPDGVTSVYYFAFVDCFELTSITIPESVTNIEQSAFSGCSGLTSITIPDSVTSIGRSAFSGCSGLHAIWLPDRFYGETSLLSIPRTCTVLFGTPVSSSVMLAPKCYSMLFATTEGASWHETSDTEASGAVCLRSGEIGANGQSSFSSVVSGPGTLSFSWKISAGRGDFCRFYVDRTETNSIQRSTGWKTASVRLGEGSHELKWVYERGSGDATGEDAAFLDDIDWRPDVTLSVASAYGTPEPASGTHVRSYGDEVSATMENPEPANGVRQTCTGWTGTGSVPASGTGTNATFTILQDSSITWKWRKENSIKVSVTGGSCDFGEQWVADGTTTTATIEPDWHLFSVSLSGDTDGVTVSGATISIPSNQPREITATVEERKVSFDVSTAHGTAEPSGTTEWSWGDLVVASVAEPNPADGVRRVCTGWTGTGSVPASGTTATVSFPIRNDSSLVWNWRTDYRIELAEEGPVSADFAEDWLAAGSTQIVHWTTTAPYFVAEVAGDTNGVVLDVEARTLAIPADGPRAVTLSVRRLTLADALDSPDGLRWTTSGPSLWFPQIGTSDDGEDAAQSGTVTNGNDTCVLATAVDGPGAFSWTWRLDSAAGGNAGVDVWLDGEWLGDYAPGAEWSRETLDVSGEGMHKIRFEFWNAGTAATHGDRAFVDRVSWTGSSVPPGTVTVGGTDVPVSWLDENATDFITAAGGDAARAAEAQAANGENAVWECYVAGIDPTSTTNRFLAQIVVTNGSAAVTWTPDLNEGGTKNERIYTVEGKTNLGDEFWGPTNAASRFFRVKVEMPEE